MSEAGKRLLLAAWSLLVLVTGVGAALDGAREQASVAADDGVVVARAAPEVRAMTEDAVAAAPLPAVPVAVEAPAVGLAAPLVPVGKTPDGALAVPDFGTAGWYEHSARPGEPGAAVLAGHVDNTTGPDVFFTLRDLAAGDEVVVRLRDGSTTTFVVDRTEVTDKDALPVERIFNDPARPELRLITCGGDFDRSTRSYESNVIVYAHQR